MAPIWPIITANMGILTLLGCLWDGRARHNGIDIAGLDRILQQTRRVRARKSRGFLSNSLRMYKICIMYLPGI